MEDYLSKITAALSAGTVAPLPPSPNAVLVLPTSASASPLVDVESIVKVRLFGYHTQLRYQVLRCTIAHRKRRIAL